MHYKTPAQRKARWVKASKENKDKDLLVQKKPIKKKSAVKKGKK
jgi:hypothetical protein